LFPDGSGAVYRKIAGSGRASAEYLPTTRQKNFLKSLGIKKDSNIYVMIKAVME
jgi:hypothetical protein